MTSEGSGNQVGKVQTGQKQQKTTKKTKKKKFPTKKDQDSFFFFFHFFFFYLSLIKNRTLQSIHIKFNKKKPQKTSFYIKKPHNIILNIHLKKNIYNKD